MPKRDWLWQPQIEVEITSKSIRREKNFPSTTKKKPPNPPTKPITYENVILRTSYDKWIFWAIFFLIFWRSKVRFVALPSAVGCTGNRRALPPMPAAAPQRRNQTFIGIHANIVTLDMTFIYIYGIRSSKNICKPCSSAERCWKDNIMIFTVLYLKFRIKRTKYSKCFVYTHWHTRKLIMNSLATTSTVTLMDLPSSPENGEVPPEKKVLSSAASTLVNLHKIVSSRNHESIFHPLFQRIHATLPDNTSLSLRTSSK